MGLLQGVIVGFKEIWAHKLRSFLTMLGVILGVAALAAMFALVEGLFAGWKQVIEEQGGIEKISTEREPIPKAQQPFRHIARQRRLDDILAVRANVGGIAEFSPELEITDAVVRYRNETVWCRVQAVTEGILAINNYEVESGRFITDIDRRDRARIVVLGTYPADELFGMYGNVLGRQVHIKGEPFRVVGLLKHYQASQGGGGHNYMDWKNRIVFLPLETGMARLTGTKDLTWLNFEVKDSSRVPIVTEMARNVLFFTHRRIQNFRVRSNEEMIERFAEMSGAFSISLGIIAGISLVVGGIGIMNIMLASINERVREIGIRKAIGARNRDVLVQVLVEAVVLSLVGGMLGVFVSLFLTSTIGVIMRDTFGAPITRIAPLVLSFCISVLVGISFGLYPAFRAGKMDVIEALRYE